MLEQLRRNSRSFIIWLIFGVIIAVFIINFGPQANQTAGCGASKSSVVSVDDFSVSEHSWRFGMNSLNQGSRRQRGEYVMDALIMRELLAQAAEDAGIRVSEELATTKLKRGEVLVLGQRVDGTNLYFKDGFFDFPTLERLAKGWGLASVDQFVFQQRRELLADAMRELIIRSAAASHDEALGRFTYENDTATIDVVRFRASDYARAQDLKPTHVEWFANEFPDRIKEQYEADARLYKGIKPQGHIRQIFFAKQPTPPPTEDGSQPPADPAKANLEALREQIAAGTVTFEQAAKEKSEDPATQFRGGDHGWRTLEAPGLGATELTDALKDLEVGKVSAVIESTRGFHLLLLEGKREGDLALDDVKSEIAEKLAGQFYARAHARLAAKTALALARAGDGQDLSEMFTKEATPAPSQPGQFTPEQLQELLKGQEGLDPAMLEKLLEKQNVGGSLYKEGEVVPAEWRDPQVDLRRQPSEAAKKALGQDGEDPTAAALPEGVTETVTPAPPGANDPSAEDVALKARYDLAADKLTLEDLPVLITPPEAPKTRTYGPFTRSTEGVPGLGKSTAMMAAVFDTLATGQLGEAVYDIEDDFVIVQMVNRAEPNLEDFQRDVAAKIDTMGVERGQKLLREWVFERCKRARDSGEIDVNPLHLEETDESGRKIPVTYKACESLQP